MVAYDYAYRYSTAVYTPKEVSQNQVWQYNVSSVGSFENAINDLHDTSIAFMDSSPQAKKAFFDAYNASNPSHDLTTLAGINKWATAACSAFYRAQQGDFGATEKQNSETFASALLNNPLFKYDQASMNYVGGTDIGTAGTQLLDAANALGVNLVTEGHPYPQCGVSA